MVKLTDFKVLTFDCYGTLIDWERGIVEGLSPLTEKIERKLQRDEILEAYAHHEAFQQQYTPTKPYHEVLSAVYRRIAEQFGINVSWTECLAFGQTVKSWPAFHDSAGALQYLKRHYKLIVLTDIDNNSFTASNKKLQVEFDAIFTAEDIGSYKPSLRNFEYMFSALARSGIKKEEMLHVAESMYHDHEPANKFGIASCRIYRRFDQPGFGASPKPRDLPTYDFEFNTMADLAKAHHEELRS